MEAVRPSVTPLACSIQVMVFLGAWSGHNPRLRVMHTTATHMTSMSLRFMESRGVRARLMGGCPPWTGGP